DVNNREAVMVLGRRDLNLTLNSGADNGETAMRSILALSLLITLCGSASAATLHHAHRAVVHPQQGMIASDPADSFAYAPAGPPIGYAAVPYDGYVEPYAGAAQGYAPGERERFLNSVRSGG